MVPIRGRYSNFKKYNLVIATVALIVVMNQMLAVMAIYVPYGRSGPTARRTDSEEDDMDQTASAPYQQGENGGGGDGYEENEPDGPYGETPRDEEGQADMEKFFDDHLGASERDGMDKENLPSNLKPRVFVGDLPKIGPKGLIGTQIHSIPYVGSASQASTNYLDHDAEPGVDTKYIKLPNKKMIISRQITSDLLIDPEQKQTEKVDHNSNDETEARNTQSEERLQASGGPDANGSEVVAVEDDDMDKIYVTNMTNQPFRIDALGGYDPEEDFQAASRDIEEPGKVNLPRGRRGSNEQEPQVRDITFNDPEADTLFNDASETDEVTFAHDDPYQTDFEAEMQGKSFNKPATKLRKEALDDLDYDRGGPTNSQARRSSNDDDSDSSWVNDGVDDMDIPSQAYQDSVLDKAAKQQALAERNAAADNGSPQQDANPEETDNQRMPNADYMKDDLQEEGDKAK